jgi:predicted HAD superfamily Cof-like phosphohydrolase
MADMYLDNVGEFHGKFGLDAFEAPGPAVPPDDLLGFRLNFMLEELAELAAVNDFVLKDDDEGNVVFVKMAEEIRENNGVQGLADSMDALVDLLYVLMGTVRYFGFHTNSPQGIRFHTAWGRVQRANMSKVKPAQIGDSKRHSMYDIVKPAGWIAPDLRDLV